MQGDTTRKADHAADVPSFDGVETRESGGVAIRAYDNGTIEIRPRSKALGTKLARSVPFATAAAVAALVRNDSTGFWKSQLARPRSGEDAGVVELESAVGILRRVARTPEQTEALVAAAAIAWQLAEAVGEVSVVGTHGPIEVLAPVRGVVRIELRGVWDDSLHDAFKRIGADYSAKGWSLPEGKLPDVASLLKRRKKVWAADADAKAEAAARAAAEAAARRLAFTEVEAAAPLAGRHGDVRVSVFDETYRVDFPMDRSRNAEICTLGAWSRAADAWVVPGVSRQALAAWLDRRRELRTETDRLDAESPITGRFGRRGRITVSRVGEFYRLGFEYDEALVDVVRAVSFADFERATRSWLVPIASRAELAATLDAHEADEARAEERRKARRVERDEADRAAGIVRQVWWRETKGEAPEVGDIVRERDGSYRIVIEVGRGEWVPEDASSLGGPPGWEKGWSFPVALRVATDEESTERRTYDELEHEKHLAMRLVEEAMRIAEAEGRMVTMDDHLAYPSRRHCLVTSVSLYGGGVAIWVEDDGRLVAMQNNGADGDTWARNTIRTHGAGGFGWILKPSAPSYASIVERLRAAAPAYDRLKWR